MKEQEVIFEISNVNAKAPFYATEGAAGADLYASVALVIPARGKKIIATNISLQIPEGHYVRIESRSGLSANFSLEKGAGIIDSDYEGELNVILYNHSDSEYIVEVGTRVAQIILHEYIRARFVQGKLQRKSQRGISGFGSTGV